MGCLNKRAPGVPHMRMRQGTTHSFQGSLIWLRVNRVLTFAIIMRKGGADHQFWVLQIAYFVGVQMDEGSNNQDGQGLSIDMRRLSVVGAVKVAVRSLSMGAGPSKA